jgi:triacylglycerol lipase
MVSLPPLPRRMPRVPPLWREARWPLELAQLGREPLFNSPPRTRAARAVLLIPGFMTGDGSLSAMRAWLQRCGHATGAAGIRFNVDCSAAAVERIEQRLERFAHRCGRPVTVVGQSRGGLFARALAVRRPDLVEGVVTLGTPHVRPMSVHPLVLLQGGWVATLGSAGMPGLAKHSCRNGECCEDFRSQITARLPEQVRFVSVYSRSDGIVDWQACLDLGADCVEIQASHCGMGVNVATYRVLTQFLAGGAGNAEDMAALPLAA